MFTRWMKIMLSLLVLGTLAACSPQEFRPARSTAIPTTGVTGSGNPSCGNTTQVTGRVYDDGVSSGFTFEQRVKGLLSASIDPQYFGTISGVATNVNTGVSIEGHISYDSSGNILVSQTTLKLVVTDSYVGQADVSGGVVQAYPVNFTSANSGTVNMAAKTFTVLFKDNYGEITLAGNFSSAVTTGTITYTNSATVGSGNYPTSGTLGAFQISTCSLLN
jgi:hypothetical protein